MSFSLLLIIAISLGVDAMVVSLSCGLKVGRIIWPAYLKIALAFGIFQGLMTAIGLGLGHLGYVFFQPYAHLIATGFFLGLAGKSLHEFIKQNKSPKLNKLPELLTQNEDRSPKQYCLITCRCQRPLCLLLLAVATSIDALAVGVVLAFYRISIGGVIGLIAGVAFLMSLFGLFLGRSLGRLLGHWPSLVAMVIFMILAVKALQGGN